MANNNMCSKRFYSGACGAFSVIKLEFEGRRSEKKGAILNMLRLGILEV